MSIKLWDGKSELQHGDWVGFADFVVTVEDWAVGFYIGKDSAGWDTFKVIGGDGVESWHPQHYSSPNAVYAITTVEAVHKAHDITAGERQP